ncbi:hypothetical protein [Streptomyces sp. NPDC052721]|uniref:hypothetical protein n=1 Tax=Streptomyces sp. NPDC052721 TaxID=3154955 RepID=UPI003413ACC5
MAVAECGGAGCLPASGRKPGYLELGHHSAKTGIEFARRPDLAERHARTMSTLEDEDPGAPRTRCGD